MIKFLSHFRTASGSPELGRGGLSVLCAFLTVGPALFAARADAQVATLPSTPLSAPAPMPPAASHGGSNSFDALQDSLNPQPSYVLSPDDQIEITVLGHPEFNAAVTLLPDGTFNYPVLGKVHAAGLTVDGLTSKLTSGLSSQLNQPEVTVYLRAGRARTVSIIGDGVHSAGQYAYRTGMHLLDLLAVAGGPASEPQLITATLATPTGETVSIDLAKLLSDADTSQNLPLSPGDTLFLVARNPEVGEVQVVGFVQKPGAYSLMPSGISVLALLNEAGGALPTARLTEVQIMHGGQVQVVDLRPLLTTDLRSNAAQIRLVPGDVLMVPENKNRILCLGEVGTKGILPIPDDQPLTLTTAYALVGGATPDGDKKNVDIIRRPPGAPATLLAFNMEDLLKNKKGFQDITLQPNDILFIQTRNHPKSLGDILGSVGSLGFVLQSGRYLGL